MTLVAHTCRPHALLNRGALAAALALAALSAGCSLMPQRPEPGLVVQLERTLRDGGPLKCDKSSCTKPVSPNRSIVTLSGGLAKPPGDYLVCQPYETAKWDETRQTLQCVVVLLTKD